MTLKSMIESDVSDVFMNTNDFAEALTFHRGNSTAESTYGVRRVLEQETEREETFATQSELVEWSVPVADLSVSPRVGDRLVATAAGETFEILPSEVAENPVVKDDSGHLWVVMTKQV